MSSLHNKTVLITGGASGIGLLMGKKVLQKGAAKLIIWDINETNIRQASEQLHDFKDRLYCQTVDIADPDQIDTAAQETLQEVSHIDILINNAGIIIGKPFDEQSPAEIQQTISVNLLGMMHTTRAFMHIFNDRPESHIVNIASAAGLMANPGMSVYAGSKWGAIGWSDSLRIELSQAASNIKVTTVEPSYIDTGMFKGVTPPLLTPLLDPNDIANKIIRAIEKDKIHLRAPFMVKLLPFLKGILPTRIFDFVAGTLFRVYHSMDTFTGDSTPKPHS